MTASSKRTLVLGGAGMLGHQLLRVLAEQGPLAATFRTDASAQRCKQITGELPGTQWVTGIDVLRAGDIERAIGIAQPQVVVNAIGVVKQSEMIDEASQTVQLNALLPHQLAALCAPRAIRLVHISTDCVFSGRRGGYSEADVPDPIDFYGRSKLLGEVDAAHCVTLRTSIIGWELEHARSLLGWFATQRGGRIRGWQRAIFSGLSASRLAELVRQTIEHHPGLTGVYHAASEPISKYDLLCGLRDALDWQVTIEPDSSVACDRSLDGTRLRAAIGWTAPAWPVMIAELAAQRSDYETTGAPA